MATTPGHRVGRWLALAAIAGGAAWESGCVQIAAAAVAATQSATQSIAENASSTATALNPGAASSMVGDTSTVNDLDRILAGMPDDSPQRADLESLRQQMGQGPLTNASTGSQRFVSDPQLGLDSDRRREGDAELAERHRSAHGFVVPQQPGGGHRFVLDPPRPVGAEAASPRDEVKPFHAARESDLEPWGQRYYGVAAPSMTMTGG